MIGAILTLGLGTFGDVGKTITLGYSSGAAAATFSGGNARIGINGDGADIGRIGMGNLSASAGRIGPAALSGSKGRIGQ